MCSHKATVKVAGRKPVHMQYLAGADPAAVLRLVDVGPLDETMNPVPGWTSFCRVHPSKNHLISSINDYCKPKSISCR